MIEIIVIVILLVAVLGLILYLLSIRKNMKQTLEVMDTISQGHSIKDFTKKKGLPATITYEMNVIVKQFEDEIIILKKVEQANKELLTSLSHDLRTPLTSLLGYLDALSEEVVTGEEKDLYINVAWKKAYDLKQFTDTLFDWFKINANEQKYFFEIVDINEYSREIIIDWVKPLTDSGFAVDVKIDDEENKIRLDKNAYVRIFNNILQNAITHGKGTYLQIEILGQPNFIDIKFTDNGVGISEAELPYVFNRLYKGDCSRGDRGSGLGLAIVNELVKAHKGTIDVISTLGDNTTFKIRLPKEEHN